MVRTIRALGSWAGTYVPPEITGFCSRDINDFKQHERREREQQIRHKDLKPFHGTLKGKKIKEIIQTDLEVT